MYDIYGTIKSDEIILPKNVELFYKTIPRLKAVVFEYAGKTQYFDVIDNLNGMFEEMIHQCLPAPDDSTFLSSTDSERHKWKYYFHHLLIKSRCSIMT